MGEYNSPISYRDRLSGAPIKDHDKNVSVNLLDTKALLEVKSIDNF